VIEFILGHPWQFGVALILVVLGNVCWRCSDLSNRHWQKVLLVGLLCIWSAAIIVLVTVLPEIHPCCHPV